MEVSQEHVRDIADTEAGMEQDTERQPGVWGLDVPSFSLFTAKKFLMNCVLNLPLRYVPLQKVWW